MSGQIDVIGAVLRLGTGKAVDNFAVGGIAAPVDLESGTVCGLAVSKNGMYKYEYHPVTGHRITGFRIPYWPEVLEMVRQAALVVPAVRTVGWDVAISEKGPVLVEGNDNWDGTLWQLPHGHGLKRILVRYL